MGGMYRLPAGVDRRRWAAVLAWGALAYAIHKYGALTGLYFRFPWYQNLTHAASASGVAALVAIAALHLGYRGRRLVAVVVGVTALAALGWEVVEYLGFLDAYGLYLHFHDFEDAAVDMVSNAVGTAVALGVIWWHAGPEGR